MADILIAPAIVVGLFLLIVIAIIILRMGATPVLSTNILQNPD